MSISTLLKNTESWVWQEMLTINQTRCLPRLSMKDLKSMVQNTLDAMMIFAVNTKMHHSRYPALGIATLWLIWDDNPSFLKRCETTAKEEKKNRLATRGELCTTAEESYYQSEIREILRQSSFVPMDLSDDLPPTPQGREILYVPTISIGLRDVSK